MGLWEIVYASILHDIGKVYYRAGHKGRHSELSSSFVAKYAGLFKSINVDVDIIRYLVENHHNPEARGGDIDKLKKADHCSAAERDLGEELLGTSTMAYTDLLVSPLTLVLLHRLVATGFIDPSEVFKELSRHLERREDSLVCTQKICYKPYPLTKLSKGLSILERKTLLEYITSFNGSIGYSELRELYKEVVEELERLFNRLNVYAGYNVFDKETLYNTVASIVKPTLLFVPDAVYGLKTGVPTTSLAAHLLSTASLATTYHYSDSYVVVGLDISGVQGFIRSIARHRGALRQLRGRSLLLQLLSLALKKYITSRLGLPPSIVFTEKADKINLIIPSTREYLGKIDAIRREIEEFLYKFFHGDIYVSIGYSSPVSECRFESPWSREYLVNNSFARALAEAVDSVEKAKARKYSLIEVNKFFKDKRLVECRECRSTIPVEYTIDLSNHRDLVERLHLDPEIDRLCYSCFYSQIAGTAAENLHYIIMVHNSGFAEELWREITSDPWSALPRSEIGVVVFRELGIVFYIVSKRDEKISDEKLLDTLLKFISEQFRRLGCTGGEVIVYKVNDLRDFIPEPKEIIGALKSLSDAELKIGFSYLFTNFSLRESDLDRIGRIGDRYTLTAWARIDVDNMSSVGYVLAGSPARYLTIVELISFFVGYLAQSILSTENPFEEGVLGDRVIVVFSGGDDTFIVGRLAEAYKYIDCYWRLFRDYIGYYMAGDRLEPLLTISAGVKLADPEYPAYLGYRDSWSELIRAKDDGRNRVRIPGVYSIEEKEIVSRKPGGETRATTVSRLKESIEWSIYDKIIGIVTGETDKAREFIELIAGNKSLFYKVYSTLKTLVENIEKNIAGNRVVVNESIITPLIHYVYIYQRHQDRLDKAIELLENIYGKVVGIKKLKPEEIAGIRDLRELYRQLTVILSTLAVTLMFLREGFV